MASRALAAAVTPLTSDGGALDEDAFGPLTDFFVSAGLDGVLVAGTTGEGVLLTVPERSAPPSSFSRRAAAGRS